MSVAICFFNTSLTGWEKPVKVLMWVIISEKPIIWSIPISVCESLFLDSLKNALGQYCKSQGTYRSNTLLLIQYKMASSNQLGAKNSTSPLYLKKCFYHFQPTGIKIDEWDLALLEAGNDFLLARIRKNAIEILLEDNVHTQEHRHPNPIKSKTICPW